MKVVMVMFDSLNRQALEAYGCDSIHAPNFKRLAKRTLTFDQSYVCSMPCMPARRDFHTGRPNFMHRSWGPLEPFDQSMPRLLQEHGVYTHLATDHGHYFEDGGATYHGRYSSWEYFRGQEGDPCYGQIAEPKIPDAIGAKERQSPNLGTDWGNHWRQDWVNRATMPTEADQPQPKTFAAGIDFMKRNKDQDNWFLQIETFDPHEPFFTQQKYKDLYPEHYENYKGRHFDWPPYRKVQETPEEVEHVQHEYASLVSMCDTHLGKVLDLMDEQNMWEDTMLIVWTDHGFLLGEHDWWAKCRMPFYDEIAHTPFFIWDPRTGKAGERRSALVQPAIDLAPTILDFFGASIPDEMLGKNLQPVIEKDAPVRDAAVFGIAGGHINVTDGRYVYMRGPTNSDNQPLFDYTLMPTAMRGFLNARNHNAFSDMTLVEPFSFTQGCKVLKIPNQQPDILPDNDQFLPTMLFDLENDPKQIAPIDDPIIEQKMEAHLVSLMETADAPSNQYERLGLAH